MSETPDARPDMSQIDVEAHGYHGKVGSPSIEVAAHGVRIVLPPETEAHGLKYRGLAESEAHGLKFKDLVETEAHGLKFKDLAETDAHHHVVVSFQPDAPAQILELRYRPSASAGEPPEVELHMGKWKG